MNSKIISLSKNEDFKSILSGKKLSNKYLTIFFRKLSNKDNKSATKLAKKMRGILKDNSSINLLINSEIFKIEKKSDQLNQVYDLMIKNAKLKYVKK